MLNLKFPSFFPPPSFLPLAFSSFHLHAVYKFELTSFYKFWLLNFFSFFFLSAKVIIFSFRFVKFYCVYEFVNSLFNHFYLIIWIVVIIYLVNPLHSTRCLRTSFVHIFSTISGFQRDSSELEVVQKNKGIYTFVISKKCSLFLTIELERFNINSYIHEFQFEIVLF